MLTDPQKQAAQAIVNIFETGRVLGDYGQVTLLAGDTGHLTYGRAQTTLASGNLGLLIQSYCNTTGAEFALELRPFLAKLDAHDIRLDNDAVFRDLLHRAGDDPVMQNVQDEFFDRVYWGPAVTSAAYIDAKTALGTAIVYDGRIHGSWHMIRDRTIAQFGSLVNVGETDWFDHYVQTRKNWLSSHSNSLLKKTVYRMDAFSVIMNSGNWKLGLPFTVRGITIDQGALNGSTGQAPIASSAANADRLLKLTHPLMRGEDIEVMQKALVKANIHVDVDGVFGPGTQAAIKQFQRVNNLTADGIAGAATLSLLIP